MFTTLTSIAVPLADANVDTDIIFPARFLLITEKKGLGRYAFYEKRYGADGAPIAEFALNRDVYRGAAILVAGDNFGCGSSREQAPWALNDLGIRCLISTSFGEIFQSNCFRNGMLPITVAPAELGRMLADATEQKPLTVDLVDSFVQRDDGERIAFAIPNWRREALLAGWDEIDVILNRGDRIAEFEVRQKARMPWLYR